MVKNSQTHAKGRTIQVEEALCEYCGREFKTRDTRLGQKMLRLHLKKEHKTTGEEIKNYGRREVKRTRENPTAHKDWTKFCAPCETQS